MRLLKRVNRIIAAQLHGMVDAMEAPEQLLKQAIREMENAITRAAESTAHAIAVERRLHHQSTERREQASQWAKRAERFVRDGNDVQARRALSRKLEVERWAALSAEALPRARESSEALRTQLDRMRRRLEEAKSELVVLVARKRTADAQRRFIKAAGGFDADAQAFLRFEELRLRIADDEATSEVLGEMAGANVNNDPVNDDVETELALLKSQFARTT